MDTATGELNITITSQVVVCAQAERAEKLILFFLYLFSSVDKTGAFTKMCKKELKYI